LNEELQIKLEKISDQQRQIAMLNAQLTQLHDEPARKVPVKGAFLRDSCKGNSPAMARELDMADLPLIRKAAATGKPLIISTGMASEEELRDSVQAARQAGCRDLILLKCTSTYPATCDNTHLRTIPDIAQRFSCHVGLSDHTAGIGAAVASVAMGAVLIEKHFTLRRADGGVDSAFSLEPHELKSLVVESDRAWQALGAVHYGPTAAEEKSLAYRRSLYVVADMQPGEVLTSQNLRAIRPGHGLPPRFYDEVLGKPVAKAVKRGTPLSWELVNTKGKS
jgi:N-acetylneuraminate synthase